MRIGVNKSKKFVIGIQKRKRKVLLERIKMYKMFDLIFRNKDDRRFQFVNKWK